MGASSSKMEEDKALQLCSDRKRFVKQALDGRCSLAVSHVTYIQSLRSVGVSLQKFVEPEAPMESSLCTSTSATPEPLTLTEKSPSQFSFYSPTFSHRVDAAETFSPSPPPPPRQFSGGFQANHMKFRGSLSKKVEEKPSLPVVGTVTTSSTPQNTTPRSSEMPETPPFEADPEAQGNSPWDYFFPSGENQFSVQEGGRVGQPVENAEDIRRFREDKGVPELGEEEDNFSLSSREQESCESEDEFDEPPADTLVRSFENRNRNSDHVEANFSSTTHSSEKSVSSETELLNHKKSHSPDSSPLPTTPSAVSVPNGIKATPVKDDVTEDKVAPEDFLTCMKYIESLFIKASESGKEVPKMLEANKLHFRPIVPNAEGDSVASKIFKACFSCGEDPGSVPEEPAQTAMKYLTWQRTTSSLSSSSRIPLASNSKDDMEDPNSDLFENFCMISGSHASTLDRLYAWERKLYDEVKGSKIVRRKYDVKCRILRQLESKGESSHKIDRTRAVIKDLHSRIRVAIHRINDISSKIEELRDKELQPQLEELIKGLNEMWKEMSLYHKLQYNAISIMHGNSNTRISVQSESRRQITIRLENDLVSLASSFTKWIGAQKSYLQAINGWLLKCILPPGQSSKKRKNRGQLTSWRNGGPPIYITCGVWLEKFGELPTKDVVNSIKSLAAETTDFLPRQEKGQGKSLTNVQSNIRGVGVSREEVSEDCTIGFDRFRSSMVDFLGQLNKFAKSSAGMYEDLQKEIQEAKTKYDQWSNHVKAQS